MQNEDNYTFHTSFRGVSTFLNIGKGVNTVVWA